MENSKRPQHPGWKAESSFILDRAQNVTNSAEGSVLPPRQVGATRVPIVTGLRVATAVPFIGGTQFTLLFNDPPLIAQIANYNLYYSLGGNAKLNNAGTCRRSPAIFNINTPEALTVAFVVQTVMSNGFSSEISGSPSCTGKTIAGVVTPADLTGLNIVFGGNNLTPAGLVPYVSAPAILDVDSTFQFDSATKNFGVTGSTPTAAITTDRDVAFGVDTTVHTADFTLTNFWASAVDTSGGDVNVTLPSAAGLPGQWFVVKKSTGDANKLELFADGTDLIDGAASVSTTGAYGLLSVFRIDASTWGVI